MKLQEEKLTELSKLLRDSIQLYQDDRELAVNNFNDLKKQLEDVLGGGFEMSEDAKLEAEVNKALKLVFEASKKLDNVIYNVTQVIIAQLNNESREKIAEKFTAGNFIPQKPVDFQKLRNSPRKELQTPEEYEED